MFQPGYSIEWKKKIPEKDDSKTINRISENHRETDPINPTTTAETNLPRETEKPYQERIPEPKFREDRDESISPVKAPEIVCDVETENHQITSSIRQKVIAQPGETEERKEFELFGVMSFGLYFCSLAMAVVSIFALNALPTIVIACFMILLSFIFGIISVKRYRRNRSGYRRNFFGYFGLIASAVTIFWTAFLLLFAWGLDSF